MPERMRNIWEPCCSRPFSNLTNIYPDPNLSPGFTVAPCKNRKILPMNHTLGTAQNPVGSELISSRWDSWAQACVPALSPPLATFHSSSIFCAENQARFSSASILLPARYVDKHQDVNLSEGFQPSLLTAGTLAESWVQPDQTWSWQVHSLSLWSCLNFRLIKNVTTNERRNPYFFLSVFLFFQNFMTTVEERSKFWNYRNNMLMAAGCQLHQLPHPTETPWRARGQRLGSSGGEIY